MITDINLNLYRIFYILAKSKTFGEASDKLCISQPAVSKHIKNLEETLKVKLFYRDKTGLKLTSEGRDLLDYIEKAYNIIVSGQRKIIENKNLDNGKIIVGAPSHIASFYLMKYIKEIRKDYPGIIIKIVSGSTSFLINELEQHRIDFIIDSSPIEFDYNYLTIEKLASFDTCFITNNKNISKELCEDMEKYIYILPVERSTIRKNLEKVFKTNNIKLPLALEVEMTELIIDAVKNDIGIGYVIREAVSKELESNNLFVMKTNLELPIIELNLVYNNEYLTFAARKFIKDYIKM